MDGESKFDLSNRFYTLIAIIVAGLIIYLLGNLAYHFASLPENAPQDLMVSGEGKAYIKPDIAILTLGLRTEGAKSVNVVQQNNAKMNDIIQAVKDLGIDEKDIKTTLYNLSPLYNYTEAKGRIFQGYSLDQQITVKVRDFDKISDVLDKATSKGATNVSDLQFTLDNPETAKAEARQKAIDQAKQKAADMAKSAGLRIMRLVNISENYNNYPQPVYGMGGAAMEKSISSIAPRIETGQQEIDVTVNLTYRVR